MDDLKKISNEELDRRISILTSEVSRLNNIQMANKILMNSEYGALANKWFRYYDIRLASAVTVSGQLAIRWIENYLMAHPLQKKYNWEVIYSDTDSVYLSVEKLAKKIENKNPDPHNIVDKLSEFSDKVLQPIINKGYDLLSKYVNANENRMFMKREKISSKGLWTGKKKYALLVYDDEGVRYQDAKLKVTGIETVRSSTPPFVKKRLEKVLKLILTEPDNLAQYIDETKKMFYGADPYDIALTVSVRTLEKYKTIVKNNFTNDTELSYKKGTPIGVRAAIVYNGYIIKNDLYNRFPEIMPGDKIKYLFLKMPNPMFENVFGFVKNIPNHDEIAQYIDIETQFYKTFLKPIENITTKINMIIDNIDEFDIHSLFD